MPTIFGYRHQRREVSRVDELMWTAAKSMLLGKELINMVTPSLATSWKATMIRHLLDTTQSVYVYRPVITGT
jgi:hypothetical protein